jgi:AraC-like DNA-binding protein
MLEDIRFNACTIAEIAQMSGFSNADHFSVRFRKSFGVPPTAYRWQRQNGPPLSAG